MLRGPFSINAVALLGDVLSGTETRSELIHPPNLCSDSSKTISYRSLGSCWESRYAEVKPEMPPPRTAIRRRCCCAKAAEEESVRRSEMLRSTGLMPELEAVLLNSIIVGDIKTSWLCKVECVVENPLCQAYSAPSRPFPTWPKDLSRAREGFCNLALEFSDPHFGPSQNEGLKSFVLPPHNTYTFPIMFVRTPMTTRLQT